MIAIMQDYGEVVCCVGSSFNSANPAIFIQADIGWVLCLKNSHSWLNLFSFFIECTDSCVNVLRLEKKELKWHFTSFF